jgi:outer membrane protein assembly factor BamB
MIDLGVLGPDAVPARRARGRRQPLPAPPRWLAVPVALAAAWFGLAGAITPGSTGLTALSSVAVSTNSQHTVAGDSLYVAEPTDTGGQVTAYRLRDGRARWSVPVRLPAAVLSFTAADGVLLASVNAPGLPGDQTVALDEETGQTLWSSSGVFQALIPAQRRALLTRAFPMNLALVPGARPTDELGTEVAAVDVRDGRVAWQYQMMAGCEHAMDGAPAPGARMAVLCPADPPAPTATPGGPVPANQPVAENQPVSAQPLARSEKDDLRTVDLETGQADPAVRLTLSVPVPPNPLAVLRLAGAPIRPVLSVVAGRILVGAAGDNADGTVTLNVYDLATLRPLWTRQMSDTDYGATPCAGQLCLTDAYGLAVVDPGTGTVRWHTAEPAFTQPPGVLADRLLVRPLDGTRAALVDVGTGRSVLDVSGWRAVAGGSGAVSLFAHWQPQPDGRAWFATVTMDPPALDVIGFAPDVLQDRCTIDGDYLTCQTLTQTLRVWRYRG